MFEKIKAWIKRKRETAREQQAADRLIKHIEQALGFELYEWQRMRITHLWGGNISQYPCSMQAGLGTR